MTDNDNTPEIMLYGKPLAAPTQYAKQDLHKYQNDFVVKGIKLPTSINRLAKRAAYVLLAFSAYSMSFGRRNKWKLVTNLTCM